MKFLRKTFFYSAITLTLFFCAPQSGNESPLMVPPKPISLEDFQIKLKEWHNSDMLKTASVGVCVLPLDSSDMLLSYNENQALATASTMKAITTASSLLVLGDDFKFTTSLEYEGEIKDGVLKGNLYIKGGGDPILGYKKYSGEDMEMIFAKWGNLLKQKYELRTIEGSVIADPTIFESQLASGTWSWEDMGNYYGAGASGLNINQNEYRIFFKPATIVGGQAKVLRTEPEIDGINFINEMKTGAKNSGDNGYIYGAHYSNTKYLRGSIPSGVSEFSIKGAMPDPALFCAQAFTKVIQSQGIKVTEAATVIREQKEHPKRKLITSYSSKPLSEIIIPTNHKSINLNTEAILKMMGTSEGEIGGHKNGAQTVKELWAERGVDMQGFFMEDGSGLSRFNAVTPKQMVSILRKMSKTKSYEKFKNSLPIFGETGTLERIGRNSFAKGKIHAKSGYIKRVRGYVGYATTLNGKEVAFAVMVNNYNASYSKLNSFFRDIMEMVVKLEA